MLTYFNGIFLCWVSNPTDSAKEVDDLLTEVEDLTLQDEKREDKPKKDKKKVSEADGRLRLFGLMIKIHTIYASLFV